jgi:hypothetical protein
MISLLTVSNFDITKDDWEIQLLDHFIIGGPSGRGLCVCAFVRFNTYT